LVRRSCLGGFKNRRSDEKGWFTSHRRNDGLIGRSCLRGFKNRRSDKKG